MTRHVRHALARLGDQAKAQRSKGHFDAADKTENLAHAYRTGHFPPNSPDIVDAVFLLAGCNGGPQS